MRRRACRNANSVGGKPNQSCIEGEVADEDGEPHGDGEKSEGGTSLNDGDLG
jgi:hypothetical protein